MSGVTQVTVVEGSVGLLPGEKQWHGQESEVVLKTNQQLELAASLTQPKLVDANKALAWRLGQLHFEGETLLHVVNELNRFYNSSIKLADKSLESKKVVAVFPLKNTFDVNLNHLKRALQLSSTTTDSGEVVLGIN
jgi:ferric-dicitrate binding protein FerR (iron transport regulator)